MARKRTIIGRFPRRARDPLIQISQREHGVALHHLLQIGHCLHFLAHSAAGQKRDRVDVTLRIDLLNHLADFSLRDHRSIAHQR